MRKSDFSRNAPGRLVRSDGPSGQYWAFVPDPLPPRIKLDLETINRLSEADQTLGELNGAGRLLPNPHLLIGPFLRREAVASSRIEGTVTDYRQLVLFEADPAFNSPEADGEGTRADRQEVLNYVNAMRYGFDRLRTLPPSLRLMREVHERLMHGVRGYGKTPGEFRSCQNMIGRHGQGPGEARFVPPPASEMSAALGDLESYMHKATGLPTLIDLALIHYQFETIHPFLDGNGRLGRLMIPLLLCWRGRLSQPLLYLSAFFEANRDAYVDHLLRLSQAGDWKSWIDFFLEGVATQSRRAIRRCQALLDLWNEYRARAHEVGSSTNLLRLVDLLLDRPAITINQAADALGVTFRAAHQNIEKLEEAGILQEITGRSRDRIYMAPRIIEITEAPEIDDSA